MAAARGNLHDNFEPEDMLFGTEDEREIVRPALTKKVNPDPTTLTKTPTTVDKMNEMIRWINDPKIKEKVIAWLTTDTAPKPPEVVTQVNHQSLKKHFRIIKKVLDNLGFDNPSSPSSRKQLSPADRTIMKACQAAVLGHKVHFILNLDAKHVFDEDYSLSVGSKVKKGAGRCRFDGVTSAELQTVVQHFEEMKLIRFYRKSPPETLEAEIQLLIKNAGPNADQDAIRHHYLTSGKAYHEISFVTWLARKELGQSILSTSWMKANIPASLRTKVEQEVKHIAPTFVPTPEQKTATKNSNDQKSIADDLDVPDLDDEQLFDAVPGSPKMGTLFFPPAKTQNNTAGTVDMKTTTVKSKTLTNSNEGSAG